MFRWGIYDNGIFLGKIEFEGQTSNSIAMFKMQFYFFHGFSTVSDGSHHHLFIRRLDELWAQNRFVYRKVVLWNEFLSI